MTCLLQWSHHFILFLHNIMYGTHTQLYIVKEFIQNMQAKHIYIYNWDDDDADENSSRFCLFLQSNLTSSQQTTTFIFRDSHIFIITATVNTPLRFFFVEKYHPLYNVPADKNNRNDAYRNTFFLWDEFSSFHHSPWRTPCMLFNALFKEKYGWNWKPANVHLSPFAKSYLCQDVSHIVSHYFIYDYKYRILWPFCH